MHGPQEIKLVVSLRGKKTGSQELAKRTPYVKRKNQTAQFQPEGKEFIGG